MIAALLVHAALGQIRSQLTLRMPSGGSMRTGRSELSASRMKSSSSAPATWASFAHVKPAAVRLRGGTARLIDERESLDRGREVACARCERGPERVGRGVERQDLHGGLEPTLVEAEPDPDSRRRPVYELSPSSASLVWKSRRIRGRGERRLDRDLVRAQQVEQMLVERLHPLRAAAPM